MAVVPGDYEYFLSKVWKMQGLTPDAINEKLVSITKMVAEGKVEVRDFTARETEVLIQEVRGLVKDGRLAEEDADKFIEELNNREKHVPHMQMVRVRQEIKDTPTREYTEEDAAAAKMLWGETHSCEEPYLGQEHNWEIHGSREEILHREEWADDAQEEAYTCDLPRLLELCDHTHASVREAAAQRRFREVLLKLKNDPHPAVRCEVVGVLAEELFEEYINDEYGWVRGVLAQFCNQEQLKRMYKDKSHYVRARVARRINDVEILKILSVDECDEDESKVRYYATKRLNELINN